MAEVTGRIGDQEVALDNAATEATLRDLLAAMKGQTAALSKLSTTAGQAGISPQAIAAANKGLQQVGAVQQTGVVAGKALGLAFNGLSKTALVLGGVLGDLVASGVKTIGNLSDFAGSMIDGKASVSGLMAAFKDLPLGLGVVAGIFEKIAKIQEENFVAYQQLSKSGINFAGQLLEMKQQGLELGLTLDQFGNLLSKNSESIAKMGTNAEQGARNFVNAAKELRNSELGEQLRALGFSAEDSADGLLNYIKMTGGRSADEMKNTKGITEAAGSYMKQLDMLATLTGKNREEQEKALQKAQQNAAFESYLQTLDEDGRKKAMAGLANAMAMGGEDAVQLLQAKFMGIPAVTEGAQMLEATLPGLSKGLDGIVNATQDSSKTIGDVNKASAQGMADTQKDMKNYSKEMIAAMSLMGGPGSQTLLAAQSNLNRALKQGLVTQDDYEKAMNDLTAAQNRSKTQADEAAKSQKSLQDAGANIFAALAPVIQELTVQMNGLAIWFTSFLSENKGAMADFGKTLAGILDWVKKTLQDLFSPGGMERQIDKLGKFLGAIMQKAWDNFSIFGKKNQPDRESAAYSPTGYESGSIPGAADGGIVKAKPGGQLIRAAEVGMNEAFVPLPDGNKIPVDFDFKKLPPIPKEVLAEFKTVGSNMTDMMQSLMPKQEPLNLDMKMPDFSADIGKGLSEFKAEMQKFAAENSNSASKDIGSMFADLKNNIFGNQQQSSKAPTELGSAKDLLVELQTLNKQTAQMISFMRETTDFSRRNLDAIRGLNGNLLI